MTNRAILRWPDNISPADPPGTWAIARVKPRHEKAFARDLEEQCVPFYLPLLYHGWNGVSRAARGSWMPLLPGYVPFVQTDRFPVFATGRVLSLLRIDDQERFARDLHQLGRVSEAGGPTAGPCDPSIGDPATVIRGPLRGVTGRFQRFNNRTGIVIGVEMLGIGVHVVMDKEAVRIATS